MNALSIRITHRDGNREQVTEIDCRTPPALLSPVLASNETIDDDAMVPGNADDMASALTQIATELKCDNNLDDMLHAIDRLTVPTTPAIEWIYSICDDKEVDKETADKAIAALGNGARYPTLAEQESSRDITRWNPACDPLLHPKIKPGAYWTDEPYAPDRVSFWVVSFYYGYSFERPRYNRAFVRAVRSLPPGQ